MPTGKTDGGRLLLALAVYTGIVALTYREAVFGPLLAEVTSTLALTTAALLREVGLDAIAEGRTVLLASGTVYDVSYRCTGVLPITCLSVCILASHAGPRAKLAGIGAGTAVLLALNQVRIVHLIWIHEVDTPFFRFAHDVLWGTVPVLAVLGLFAGWRIWLQRRTPSIELAGAATQIKCRPKRFRRLWTGARLAGGEPSSMRQCT